MSGELEKTVFNSGKYFSLDLTKPYTLMKHTECTNCSCVKLRECKNPTIEIYISGKPKRYIVASNLPELSGKRKIYREPEEFQREGDARIISEYFNKFPVNMNRLSKNVLSEIFGVDKGCCENYKSSLDIRNNQIDIPKILTKPSETFHGSSGDYIEITNSGKQVFLKTKSIKKETISAVGEELPKSSNNFHSIQHKLSGVLDGKILIEDIQIDSTIYDSMKRSGKDNVTPIRRRIV